MVQYSAQPGYRIFLKYYGFFYFCYKMSQHVCKNTVKTEVVNTVRVVLIPANTWKKPIQKKNKITKKSRSNQLIVSLVIKSQIKLQKSWGLHHNIFAIELKMKQKILSVMKKYIIRKKAENFSWHKIKVIVYW